MKTRISREQFRVGSLATWAVLLVGSLAGFDSGTSARAADCVAPPAGLVAWWPGEGNADDVMGGNGGISYGGVVFTNGLVGQAFRFNGSSGHVRIADRPSLHFTNALTLEAWINPASHGAWHGIFQRWDAVVGPSQMAYTMSLDASGWLHFAVSANGRQDGVVYVYAAMYATNMVVPLNQWTHVAGTYDGAALRIYVNGVLRGEVAHTGGVFAGTNDLAIGGLVGGLAPGQVIASFAGLIDEPAVYNRALSAAEIQAIYEAGSSGKCVGPPSVFVDGAAVGGGTIDRFSPVQITMLSGFGRGSDIYYTLNGTAPDFTKTIYRGPFTLARSATIRAIAYNQAYTAWTELGPITVQMFGATTAGGGSVSMAPAANSGGNGYVTNTLVTATATPSSGCSFLGWLGEASGTSSTVTVAMTLDKGVQGIFGTPISTNVLGSGSLLLSPQLPLYPFGTAVRLTALPQSGNFFFGWHGVIEGTNNPATLVVTGANPVVTATFAPLTPGKYSLGVLVEGQGNVTANPYALSYSSGQAVSLTAAPDAGQTFLGWSGDASGTANPLSVTMNQSRVITASFTKRPTLSIPPDLAGVTDQGFRVFLSGEFGTAYQIHGSTDLTNWPLLGFVTNTFGTSQFTDTDSTNFPHRFYEAAENPLGPRFVWLPAGQFVMGSPTNEVDRWGDAEGPQTQVTLTRGFYLGRYEVTQGEYLSVIGSNPSYFTGDTNRPVESVSWAQATNYCAQLSARERLAGRLPAGWAYRLPTEAEWEYACRAGTTNRFYYGDDPGYAYLPNYAWYSANSGGTTYAVGEKQPSQWGLYDMSGNVSEWCSDWYGYYPGGSVTDPAGAASGSARVYRGGSWLHAASLCRSARRHAASPTDKDYTIGFRVVLAPGQP